MNHPQKTISLSLIVQLVAIIVIVPFLPLLISGHWYWWEAWVYAIANILGFAISRALAARRHPDILAERAQTFQHQDAKTWDKILVPLLGVGGAMIPLIAGLDARLSWSSPFSMPVKIVSLVIFLAGFTLASYALIENRFFSGMVRIQFDRGHQVVSGGPYRWIRHPGYAGALLSYLATPLFLDSVWAFLPIAFLIIILAIRTNLEDRTLQDELEGFRDYASRVRYRLVPGVW